MLYRCFLLAFSVLVGCSQQPQTAEEHLEFAASQLEAGRTDEAIRSYRIVLLQDSLNYPAQIGLVHAYEAKGNLEAAHRLQRKIIESAYTEGLAAFNQGDLPRARTLFDITLSIKPNFSLALNRIADIHASQGDTASAIEGYQRSIRADSLHAGAHTTLGQLLMTQDRLSEAQASFERAIALDINHINAYLGLGDLFGAQGKWAQSAEKYRTALRVDPQSAPGKEGLSQARKHL